MRVPEGGARSRKSLLGDNYSCAPHCLTPFATERGAVASRSLLPGGLAGGLTVHGRLRPRLSPGTLLVLLENAPRFPQPARPRRRRGSGNFGRPREKLLSGR